MWPFKKKEKKYTPNELIDMVKDLEADYEKVSSQGSISEEQKQDLISKSNSALKAISRTRTRVEKSISDLSERTFWAAAEMVGQDIKNLRRGIDLLDELEAKVNVVINAVGVPEKDEIENQPGGPQ